MNFNRNFMILAVSVALSAGTAFSAQSGTARDARSEVRQERIIARHGRHLAKVLNLSEAQKQQAKAIRQKHKTSNEGLRTELRQITEQIRTARQAGNTPEAQRLAALREPLLARAQEARQAHLAELKSLLTSEQQGKLDELQKSRQARRQMHRRG